MYMQRLSTLQATMHFFAVFQHENKQQQPLRCLPLNGIECPPWPILAEKQKIASDTINECTNAINDILGDLPMNISCACEQVCDTHMHN